VREGWEDTTLGEVVSFKGGGTPSTEKTSYWNGDIPWVSPKDMKSSEVGDSIDKITADAIENSAASLIPKDAILIVVRSGILARTIPLAATTRPLAVNQDIKALCPQRDVDPRYLHYFMQMSEPAILKLVTRGATVHRLSTDCLKALKFAKPPLPEQRRIIAILDEALTGLATASANAEKNLKNARELFDSYLNSIFTQKGNVWPERRLSEVCREMTVGHVGPMAKQYKRSGIFFLRSQNIKPFEIDLNDVVFIDDSFHRALAKSQLRPGDVAIVRTGYPGTAAVIPDTLEIANCADLVIVRPSDQVDPRYIAAFFNSSFGKHLVGGNLNGAAQKHFNVTSAKAVKIGLPPRIEQQRLVQKIDEVRTVCRALELAYQKRSTNVADLKRAILQKAFSGELTSAHIGTAVASLPMRRPSLIPISGISPTDLHAGIIAIACQKHQGHPKQDTFGRVKAEKISHMVEAQIGIELERKPIKDAAGPNDYRHLKKVESRAEKAGFFSVKQTAGGGYTFVRKNRFDELVGKTRKCLGQYNDAVDAVINEFLPMDTQQAEIFATVYAAWNNLLIDGQDPTDDGIVREARDNWHPDKLRIAPDRFFAAINWMRTKGIVPKGDGKKVLDRDT
jgi:type I restriction enzyme, S subunit